MLEAKSLRKARVASSSSSCPSPASIQPTRLAILVNDDDDDDIAFFASGCHLYRLQIPVGDSHSHSLLLNQGKEGLLIPQLVQVLFLFNHLFSAEKLEYNNSKTVAVKVAHPSMLHQCLHRYEIQSVALVETLNSETCILGSVDSHGHLIVSQISTDGRDAQKLTFAASPQDCGVGEGSWAGLSFSSTHWTTVAVARSFPKCIDLYDQESHIRNLRTLWHPSSLTFAQSPFYPTESSVLAVTEGCQLTLWDLRMKENGGCLQRISGSPGEILYDSSISTSGNIAVAGSDRTVTVYDPRRWSVSSRWTNCSKYEITGLAFSTLDPDYIYVQGVDYEVFCGDWRKGSKIISFRGDSSWLGFNKCSERDVVGGWCDSGSIFVAHIEAKTDFEHIIEPLAPRPQWKRVN